MVKNQANAFGALSLSGFSTKPDAVMPITRRYDISNECRGRDCTAKCYLCVNSDQIAICNVLNGKKSQADAFGALSLSGFSTKPDAVMPITRRYDISNECRGRDCTTCVVCA